MKTNSEEQRHLAIQIMNETKQAVETVFVKLKVYKFMYHTCFIHILNCKIF